MMGWYGDGVGWGGWIVMSLSMVAFWALVVFAGVALFRSTGSTGPDDRGARDAMAILDERLARGEIDSQEYQARKEALRSTVR
jgi:putative membrane protein